jgi:hypothetical protein
MATPISITEISGTGKPEEIDFYADDWISGITGMLPDR